jgi:hypothetical protein
MPAASASGGRGEIAFGISADRAYFRNCGPRPEAALLSEPLPCPEQGAKKHKSAEKTNTKAKQDPHNR